MCILENGYSSKGLDGDITTAGHTTPHDDQQQQRAAHAAQQQVAPSPRVLGGGIDGESDGPSLLLPSPPQQAAN